LARVFIDLVRLGTIAFFVLIGIRIARRPDYWQTRWLRFALFIAFGVVFFGALAVYGLL
jgi:hypothetical protein